MGMDCPKRAKVIYELEMDQRNGDEANAERQLPPTRKRNPANYIDTRLVAMRGKTELLLIFETTRKRRERRSQRSDRHIFTSKAYDISNGRSTQLQANNAIFR